MPRELTIQEALAGLQPHDHLCSIFDNREQQLAVAIPFIRIGLQRGEKCVYIADDNSVEEVLAAMREGGIEAEPAMSSGALSVVRKEQTYLHQGRFDPEWMFQYWFDAAAQARREGYSALRGTGETEWTLRANRGTERWMEYESRLTQVLQQTDCLALCQYNRQRFVFEIVLDVIRTHPLVVYGSLACRNFYYVPPEEFLEPDHSGREVERMLNSIVERERLDQAMRRANQELELRVRQRTAELESFTSSVSHDLRAPLRQIDGFATMLEETAGPRLEPAERKCLERIRSGCFHMRRLINDLLGLARMGQREPALQLTAMRPLVEEALSVLRPEIEGRLVRFEIGELPSVECDPDLVRQVWTNLLANAVKFTRQRSPALVQVGCTEENGRRVFFVRDNGVGFSMRYAARLFQPFQRLHRQEDFEGTGVGLALVARIVDKHRGRAWADGKVNEGATFYFTLGG